MTEIKKIVQPVKNEGQDDRGSAQLYDPAAARQQAEEMDEHIKVLKQSDHRDITRSYTGLSKFDPREVFHAFQEEAEAFIDEIESMEGALYTDEGKSAEIQGYIKDLAADLTAEATVTERNFQKRRDDLLAKLDREIHAQEDLSSERVAQINLRNTELDGQIRGQLYSIGSTRDLEFKFGRLVEESKHDKGLARFLANNYYLFLDKVQDLDTGEMDKQRAINNISVQARKLKEYSHTPRQRALLAVRDDLGRQDFSLTAAKRNIEQHKQSYLNRYQ